MRKFKRDIAKKNMNTGGAAMFRGMQELNKMGIGLKGNEPGRFAKPSGFGLMDGSDRFYQGHVI
jgi:hypothetical protein